MRYDKAERVTVPLGLRDVCRGRVEIVAVLEEGYRVLTGAAHGVTPGTPIKLSGGAASPAAR